MAPCQAPLSSLPAEWSATRNVRSQASDSAHGASQLLRLGWRGVQLNFEDPAQLAADLHAQGFRAVWMIDPGISATPGYFAYDSGAEQDAWILKKDGKPFIGAHIRRPGRPAFWIVQLL